MLVVMNSKQFNYVRWGTLFFAIALPFIAWAQFNSWDIFSLTIYQYFSLFGLVAFMIMATHFILAGLHSYFKEVGLNKKYSLISGIIVLICILLHPALLVWQLWLSNYGLPPYSYYRYVGSHGILFDTLGATALLAFLFYEVLVRLKQHTIIAKYWFYILASQLVALIFIFFHAKNLGIIVNSGWFGVLWIVLFIFMLIGGIFTLADEWKKQEQHKSKDS